MKAIGAVAFAVFALMAFVASAASASSYFQAGEYPAEVKGQQEGSEGLVLVMDGLTISCKIETLTGSMFEPLEKLEVAPTNSECTAMGIAATIASEGCTYRLYANTKIMDIVCPAEKAIKVTAIAGSCEAKISGQNELKTVEEVAKEGLPKTISTKVAAKSVKYTKTKDGFLCPFSGTGEKTDGTMTTNALSKAYKYETEEQTNFFVGEVVPTSLCEVKEAGCKSPYKVTNTPLEAKAADEPAFSYTYNGTPETIKCFESKLAGKTTSQGNVAVLSSITTFSFDKCASGTPNFLNCSISAATNLPFKGEFFAAGALGDGELQMVGTADTKPPVLTVTCGTQKSCNFGAPVIRGAITGGAPAKMQLVKRNMQPSKKNDPECGTLAINSGEYVFNEPEDKNKAPQLWVTS